MEDKFLLQLCLLVSLSLLSLQERATSLAAPANQTTLHLLSLLPYYNSTFTQQPSWIEGPTLLLAEQIAVELLNARADILPGYKLQLLPADTGCNLRTRAVLAVVERALVKEPEGAIVGMVGPGCSASAATVGQLTGRATTSLLNIHGAGSLELANRTVYPNSYSTLASTRVFVDTLIRLFQRREWKSLMAFYDEFRLYYSSIAVELQKELRGHSQNGGSSNTSSDHVYFITAIYHTHIPLQLVRNQYRVVVLLVGPDLLSRVLCLAYHYGLRYPVYQFIVVSRAAQEIRGTTFTYNKNMYTCSDRDMLEMITDLIIIHYQLRPLDQERPTSSGLSYNRFIQLYHDRINQTGETDIQPSFWSTTFFDATWSLGLVLNNSMSEVNLSSYRYGDLNAIETFKRSVDSLVFDGVSGAIKFDNRTGYIHRNVDIYRVTATGDMKIVAYYNSLQDNITAFSLELISGDFEHLQIVLSVSKTAGACLLVVTVLGLLVVIILQCLTIYARNYNSVKASSPKLAQLAFCGCYLLIIGSVVSIVTTAYVDLISPKANCYLWNVLNIISSVGPTLIYGTICTRTWRLYRIFVHFNNPGKFISERALIAIVTALVLLCLVTCVVWTVVDPFISHVLNHSTELREIKDTSNRTVNLQVQTTIIHSCKQRMEYFVVWVLFLVLFNSSLMAAAAVLAFLTRHIHQKNFRTRQIMTLTYSLSGLLGLGIPAYFILLHNHSAIWARFLVSTILLNFYVFLASFMLFLPPLYPFLCEAVMLRFTRNLKLKPKVSFEPNQSHKTITSTALS